MRVEIRIDGAAELDRKLAALPLKVARRVVRQAVREAQKIALAAVRRTTAGLPVSARRGGSMKAAIAGAWELRVPRRQTAGAYAILLKLKSLPEFFHRATRTGKSTYIPAAIEYGHGAHAEEAARPYARPAADESQRAVMDKLAHDLGRGIEQAAMESA